MAGKLKIDELRYIVMEGAGARGNTYLGAVDELENQFMELKKKSANVEMAEIGSRKKAALLDYVEIKGEEETPYIRGVAGASAGAITTFALVLGLNSDEISEVLEYEFAGFISEKDVAKYRMIHADSSLMVGEDEGQFKGRKVGSEKNSEPFEYSLEKDKTEIKGNRGKEALRGALVHFSIKAIVDGAVNNLAQLVRVPLAVIRKENYGGTFEGLINFLNKFPQVPFIYRFVVNWGVKFAASKAAKKAINAKLSANSVASLLLDRGLFSAFQVREFFYDLMLFAALRETHFQRSLINYFDGSRNVYVDGKVIPLKVTYDDLNNKKYEKFKLGKRSEMSFEGVVKDLFIHLQHVSFAEFQEIMGVEYAVAVSNYSTNSPIYFSSIWTPRFRVLEAVGSSMTLPPAMRPVFNESDVLYEVKDVKNLSANPPVRKNLNRALNVSVNGKLESFVDDNGDFTRTDYQLYEYVVKKALQTQLVKDNDAYVDLNNVLGINSFMPILRNIVMKIPIDIVINDGIPIPIFQELDNDVVELNGNEYKVSEELLTFFYNAQYKGMFIDGGYFNNIPYNYFRERNPDLEGILAIKVDNDFPPDFMEPLHEKIQQHLNKEEIIETKTEFKLYGLEDFLDVESGVRDIRFEEVSTTTRTLLTEEDVYTIVRNEFNAYFSKQESLIRNSLDEKYGNDLDQKTRDKLLEKEKEVDEKVIAKIVDQWLKYNGKGNHRKEWSVPRSILSIAFDGYYFGAERGQIRQITDHNHIIPLYDFGVGTYDFRLDKVRPLAEMAKNRARFDVRNFFEQEEQQ